MGSSTVRRIFNLDLPLTSDTDSSVHVISSLVECVAQDAMDNTGEDFFYEWFEGKLDLDEDDNFIAES